MDIYNIEIFMDTGRSKIKYLVKNIVSEDVVDAKLYAIGYIMMYEFFNPNRKLRYFKGVSVGKVNESDYDFVFDVLSGLVMKKEQMK